MGEIMMKKIFLYGLFSPVIVVVIVAQFILWEILSTGQWKTAKWRRETYFPHVYQDQIESLSYQLEEERRDHQLDKTNLQRQHEKELQVLRRKYEKV
jgi:hypothetical protein